MLPSPFPNLPRRSVARVPDGCASAQALSSRPVEGSVASSSARGSRGRPRRAFGKTVLGVKTRYLCENGALGAPAAQNAAPEHKRDAAASLPSHERPTPPLTPSTRTVDAS